MTWLESLVMNRCGRALGAAMLLGVSLGLCGCGGEANTTPTVPAEGTVTFKGQPLENGSIQFLPDKGRPAMGKITNGHFVMTTNTEGDGAPPGTHKVIVTSTQDVPQKGGDTTTKSLIPNKYGDPGQSGLSVEVPAGGKKDIAIELN
jgi:hypothetical protein